MALEVNDKNFKEIVLGSDKPVVVDFWATWCGPCRMLSPIVDELAKEYDGKALVVKCNVDDATEVTAEYGIRNIPTLLFFKDGVQKEKLVGATTKATIIEKINVLI